MGGMDENAAECRAILARGSKSFHAASLLLPPRLRDPVAAVYAFCRVSDDAVDESPDPQAALARLEARLDAIYAFAPEADPVDRALSRVVRAYDLVMRKLAPRLAPPIVGIVRIIH